LLACLALAASCGKPPVDESGAGLVPLAFSAGMAPDARTRGAVTGTVFPRIDNNNDNKPYKIGAWICNDEPTPSAFPPAMTGYNNLLAELTVTDDGGGNLINKWKYTFAGTSQDILGVRENHALDIYAYYPHVAGATDLTAIPFVSGESDWMWATPKSLTAEQTIDATPENPLEVPLTFQHAMTCIEVRVRCLYVGSVRLDTMTLADSQGRLCIEGTMNALTGALALGAPADSITITPGRELNSLIFSSFYIIMPRYENYTNNQFTLSFVFSGDRGRENYSIPNVIKDVGDNDVTVTTFETGTRYIYQLVLSNVPHFKPVEMDNTTWTEKDETKEL
jgi:hypothetical protein